MEIKRQALTRQGQVVFDDIKRLISFFKINSGRSPEQVTATAKQYTELRKAAPKAEQLYISGTLIKRETCKWQ